MAGLSISFEKIVNISASRAEANKAIDANAFKIKTNGMSIAEQNAAVRRAVSEYLANEFEGSVGKAALERAKAAWLGNANGAALSGRDVRDLIDALKAMRQDAKRVDDLMNSARSALKDPTEIDISLLEDISKASDLRGAINEAKASLDELKKMSPTDVADCWKHLSSGQDESNALAKTMKLLSTVANTAGELLNKLSGEVSEDVFALLEELQEAYSVVEIGLEKAASQVSEGQQGCFGAIVFPKVNVSDPFHEFAASFKDLVLMADAKMLASRSALALQDGNELLAAVEKAQNQAAGVVFPDGALKQQIDQDLAALQGRVKEWCKAHDTGGFVDKLDKKGVQHSMHTAETLCRVFNDDFSVRWYGDAKLKGAEDFEIDMRYAPSKLIVGDIGGKLGEGTFSTVREVHYRNGPGSIESSRSRASKWLGGANGIYHNRIFSSNLYSGLFAASSKKGNLESLHVNAAVCKCANRLTATPNLIVESSLGLNQNKEEVLLMNKVDGKSLNDWYNDERSGGSHRLSKAWSKMTQLDRTKAVGQFLRQTNDLDWTDWFTGQIDRHYDNFLIDFGIHEKKTGQKESATMNVKVVGIDNDHSFSTSRIGLTKFEMKKEQINEFLSAWLMGCKECDLNYAAGFASFSMLDDNGQAVRFPTELLDSTGTKTIIRWVTENVSTLTVDIDKLPNEYRYLSKHHAKNNAFLPMSYAFALNSARKPSFISSETLEKLTSLMTDVKKRGNAPIREMMGPNLSDRAVRAARLRFEEMYNHARSLKKSKRVFSNADFSNANKIEKIKGLIRDARKKAFGQKWDADDQYERMDDISQESVDSSCWVLDTLFKVLDSAASTNRRNG